MIGGVGVFPHAANRTTVAASNVLADFLIVRVTNLEASSRRVISKSSTVCILHERKHSQRYSTPLYVQSREQFAVDAASCSATRTCTCASPAPVCTAHYQSDVLSLARH